jgi:hypothetical protein
LAVRKLKQKGDVLRKEAVNRSKVFNGGGGSFGLAIISRINSHNGCNIGVRI